MWKKKSTGEYRTATICHTWPSRSEPLQAHEAGLVDAALVRAALLLSTCLSQVQESEYGQVRELPSTSVLPHCSLHHLAVGTQGFGGETQSQAVIAYGSQHHCLV